ncbi:MAG: HDOD domain-containing protein [Pseudomonadota bacterium]
MGFLSFLSSKPGQDVAAPTAGVGAPGAAPVPAAPPQTMLRREEVIDEKNRLCGYRFSLQSSDPHVPHPETEFIAALEQAHIAQFAERRLAVIPLTLDAVVFKRHLPLMTPNTAFLIDRNQAKLPVQQLAGRMLALKESGCQVALCGATMEQDQAPLFDACDIAFLRPGDTTLPQFQAMTRELRALYPSLALAADGVQTWDEQRMCLAWGFRYCLGDFLTTTDKLDPDAKIDQGRLTSIEMLNLLRSDSELSALVEVAKQDPGITFQVLKWANAPAAGQSTAVTSLAQAIVVLGRNSLYRWLTVSMFRLGAQRERDESLLEVALTRARFLEMVGEAALSEAQRDEVFLVGLLSLFDILLGMPMQAILAKMHLSDAVRDVLLRSSGPYGPYLMLVLMVEKGMAARAAQIATGLGIDPATLSQTSTDAFHWAQESLQHTLGG